MNTADYFSHINLPAVKVDEINEFVMWGTEHNKFYTSRFGNCRIELPESIVNDIKKIFTFDISDAGVYMNVPGWVYNIHKDKNRTFAMNMLLSDENPDFEVLCYPDYPVDETTAFSIPYIKNHWFMLNTKKWHGVKNKSQSSVRYVVSIGCSNVSYDEMRSRLQV